jgi:hypothetical protein
MSPAGIARRNYGSGHRYTLDGRDVPGVTTILKTLDKPALIDWAANTTAAYAIDHWAELADMSPSERLNTLKGARWGENRRAIKRGHSVHELAERLAAGDEVDVPDELAGHVEAYVRFLDEWDPEVMLSETVVGSRRYRYGGTLDLLARVGDGRVWLFDVKTGGKGVFGETALQLAAYARADVYLDRHGDEQPMPAVDAIAAIHVRADGYSVRVPAPPIDELHRLFAHLAAVHRGIGDMRDWFGDELAAPRAAAS